MNAQTKRRKMPSIPIHLLAMWLPILYIDMRGFELGDGYALLAALLFNISLISVIIVIFRRKYRIVVKMISVVLLALVMRGWFGGELTMSYERARFDRLRSNYTTCAQRIADEVIVRGSEAAVIRRGFFPLNDAEISLLSRWDGDDSVGYICNGKEVMVMFTAFSSLNDMGYYVYLTDENIEGWFWDRASETSPPDDSYALTYWGYESFGGKWFFVSS